MTVRFSIVRWVTDCLSILCSSEDPSTSEPSLASCMLVDRSPALPPPDTLETSLMVQLEKS